MTLQGEDQQREGGGGRVLTSAIIPAFSAEKVSIAHCLFPEGTEGSSCLEFLQHPSSNKNLWVLKILEETAAAASSSFFPSGEDLGVFFLLLLYLVQMV